MREQYSRSGKASGGNSPSVILEQDAAAGNRMKLPVSSLTSRSGRRGVAETSAEAFHSLGVADYLQPKERAVLALFTGPEVKLSRQQIAVRANLPINSCCGRVDSLITAGHLEECGDRIDPQTRKRQKLLQLPRAAQASLLEDRA